MRALLAIALSVFAWGCKEKVDYEAQNEAIEIAAMKGRVPIADKYGPAAKPKFAAVRAIGTEAKAAAPVESREPLTTPVVMLDPAAKDAGPPEVVVIHLENLLDPKWENPAKATTGQAGVVAERATGPAVALFRNVEPYTVKSEIRGGVYSGENLEKDFLKFAALKFLVVVRVRGFQAPDATGNRKFVAGQWSGDVLVYQIEPRTRIGAFPFGIRGPDTAYVAKGRNQDTQLAEDFDKEVTSALHEEIRVYLENKPAEAATPPAPPVP